ncbi:unnamed protein product [Nyctereutes procyonoides]|uniref:(raccoon dog) hypothetical protein n=1 Tax=Nyctereutes procyonoides TaxID=34880 RepID=A0A811Z1U9_NYCPR|nr:unnamed protein product [Nyctereutes procyonoides]
MGVQGAPFPRLPARGAREALTGARERRMHRPPPWKGRLGERWGWGWRKEQWAKECTASRSWKRQGKGFSLRGFRRECSPANTWTAKSSPGDGFLRPKEFHRKRWWKKPLQQVPGWLRIENASWLSWELCYWMEFTFIATLQCRHLKFTRGWKLKGFKCIDGRYCHCRFLPLQEGNIPSNALLRVKLPRYGKCKVPSWEISCS